MKPIDENQRNRYFTELEIALKREGLETMPLVDGLLPVLLDGYHLCQISGGGSVWYRPENMITETLEHAFCNTKSAIFIVLPEESLTQYFMVSLMIQQLYREILSVADEQGGKLRNRVMFYYDKLGTICKPLDHHATNGDIKASL